MPAGTHWWRAMKYPGLAITVYSSMPRPASATPSDTPGGEHRSARDQQRGGHQSGGQVQDDLWPRPVRPCQGTTADVHCPPRGHEHPDHEAIDRGASTHGFILITWPRRRVGPLVMTAREHVHRTGLSAGLPTPPALDGQLRRIPVLCRARAGFGPCQGLYYQRYDLPFALYPR
jgi:hypothetical protein